MQVQGHIEERYSGVFVFQVLVFQFACKLSTSDYTDSYLTSTVVSLTAGTSKVFPLEESLPLPIFLRSPIQVLLWRSANFIKILFLPKWSLLIFPIPLTQTFFTLNNCRVSRADNRTTSLKLLIPQSCPKDTRGIISQYRPWHGRNPKKYQSKPSQTTQLFPKTMGDKIRQFPPSLNDLNSSPDTFYFLATMACCITNCAPTYS